MSTPPTSPHQPRWSKFRMRVWARSCTAPPRSNFYVAIGTDPSCDFSANFFFGGAGRQIDMRRGQAGNQATNENASIDKNFSFL